MYEIGRSQKLNVDDPESRRSCTAKIGRSSELMNYLQRFRMTTKVKLMDGLRLIAKSGRPKTMKVDDFLDFKIFK